MKASNFLTVLFLIISFHTSAQNLKALVGGTLIDGFGGTPIQNSVILIQNDRITAVGQVGSLSRVNTSGTHDSYWFDDFYSMMICSLVNSPSTTT
jgi:hypothetical protein